MTTTTSERRTLSRKTFLAGGGAMIVAIGVPRLLNPKAAYAAVNPLSTNKLIYGEYPIGVGPLIVDPAQIDSWIAILSDGTVVMKTGKVELGQGTVTAALQLVADELDVPMSKI